MTKTDLIAAKFQTIAAVMGEFTKEELRSLFLALFGLGDKDAMQDIMERTLGG